MIGIYDEQGILLTNVNFNAVDIIKGLEKNNIAKSQLSELADKLDAAGIGYKPYEMYPGTGSDAGIDLRDLANGGTGRGTAGSGIDCTKLTQQNTANGVMKYAICSKTGASWYMTQAEAVNAQKLYPGTKVLLLTFPPGYKFPTIDLVAREREIKNLYQGLLGRTPDNVSSLVNG